MDQIAPNGHFVNRACVGNAAYANRFNPQDDTGSKHIGAHTRNGMAPAFVLASLQRERYTRGLIQKGTR